MKNTVATASLADYAAVINDEHRAAYGCAQEAIEHARVAGEHLLKAKAALKHGEWLPWLAANVEVSDRQARKYMQLAENWPAVSAKLALGADLTINGALEALAKALPKPEAKPATNTTSTTKQSIADEPAPAASSVAAGPAEQAKPAKPVKPAEVERLIEVNKELSRDLAELAKQQEPLQDEVDFLRKIEDEGDKLKAACAEVKRLQVVVRGQEERIRGLMNEVADYKQHSKKWQRMYEKAVRGAQK